MKIDLGSFAFGSIVLSGGNTPSWGTSLGQSRPALKLTYPGCENIVIGMVYKSIPVDKVYIPLGKGGHVCNSLEDEGIQLAAMFEKVYVNEKRVNASFIMLIYKEDSNNWKGRKTLKYSTKIEYRRGINDIVYNSDFVNAARDALNLAEDACWLISDIFIVNQDELHMIAGIVNPDQSETYPTTELRKAAFINAIKATYDDNPHFKKMLCIDDSGLLGNKCENLQQIFYGAPGTGKSHEIKKLTTGEDVIRTTFHPDSDYSTFVGSYKPTTKEVPVISTFGGKAIKVKDDNGNELKEERIIYEFVSQAFLQAYVEAWKKFANAGETDPKKQFLVIEEINRGNCAQIFGDLFQLLDRNDAGFSEYPIKADTDLKKQLKKLLSGLTIENAEAINALYEGDDDVVGKMLDGDVLLLPNNLYIWATMNTSDQSLFPIDSAFKRRWDWRYVRIDDAGKGWKIQAQGKLYDWWDFLEKINKLVGDTTNSEDKKLGYFFCKAKDGIIDAETFVGKVIFYLWNDVFKDFEFEGEVFNDVPAGDETPKLTFNKFYRTEAGKTKVNENKVEVFLNNLKVKLVEDTIIDNNDINEPEATNNSDSQDAQGEQDDDVAGSFSFKFNNVLMNLGEIAKNVVLKFASSNRTMSAQAIRDYFVNLCKGIGVAHVVETESEYHERDGQVSQKRSASEILIPNGEKLYVTTQWRAKREDDNFIKFMDIVNKNDLGIISQE